MKIEIKKRIELGARTLEGAVSVQLDKGEQLSLSLLELMLQTVRDAVADNKVNS